jgi:predicted AlkP superfamily phosphohydrolase/phosphomutase
VSSRRAGWALFLAALAAGIAGAALTGGARTASAPRPAARHPWIVVGIDGGAWKVIDTMQARGELANFRALAERGTRAVLHTAYNASPVIWTTIATGVKPQVHGITDFVVPTAQGDVPVSSSLRRVPALWNMMSRVHRRVVVYGWWATWPAEEVEGRVVTDRVFLDVPRKVYPASFAKEVERVAGTLRGDSWGFDLESAPERRDRLMAALALGSLGEDYELTLIYFRGTDVVSHARWHVFEPDAFPAAARPLPGERDDVARVYRAVDRALGELMARAPADANWLVVSDHGFRAETEGRTQINLDIDPILEQLGYLARTAGGVDFTRTLVYPYDSPSHHAQRRMRYALAGREPGGRVMPSERRAIRKRLERDLERVRWGSGAAVFEVRDARPRDQRGGADFVVRVRPEGATPEVRIDGEPMAGRATVYTLTGTHTASTPGILIAAGPDLEPGAVLDDVHVHDIAPTLLYGLGLPVADDFAGRPRTELFNAAFRRQHPVRRIASWGTREVAGPATSTADAAMVEDLKALGYLK